MRHPTPVFDAEPSGGKDLGTLPEWDLTALYAAPDAPEIKRDLDWLEEACARFNADYQGRLATLDAPAMLDCIQRYERIDAVAGRIMSYVGLRHYQQTQDPERAKALGDAQDKVTAYTTPLVFFSLEMNRIEDERMEGLLAESEGLARYRPVIEKMRAMKPYQLSDELERFLHDQSAVGAAAWNRLFDETVAGLSFDVDGEALSIETTLNLLTDPDRARREAAARAVADVFERNVKLFARVHNTLAKEKAIEDRWRGLPTPQTARHLSNQVEPEVVQALRDAVVAAYPQLSHRYYELKRRWLGLDKLQIWDRNAPLPMQDDRVIGWDEAEQHGDGGLRRLRSGAWPRSPSPSSAAAGSTRPPRPARRRAPLLTPR